MVLTPEILDLVHSLRQVRSPVKRMRVLASAWRSFQELDENDRRDIARRLGVAGFEKIAGRIGMQAGLEPHELAELLDRLEEIDPSEAAEVMRKLEDPEGRWELTRRGFASLAGGGRKGDEPVPFPDGATGGNPEADAGRPGGAGADGAAASRGDRGEVSARVGVPSDAGPEGRLAPEASAPTEPGVFSESGGAGRHGSRVAAGPAAEKTARRPEGPPSSPPPIRQVPKRSRFTPPTPATCKLGWIPACTRSYWTAWIRTAMRARTHGRRDEAM